MNGTTFDNKCHILAELWMNYRDDEQFKDFLEYGDLAFPLAYAISYQVISKSDKAESFIEEIWQMFLEMLGIFDTEDGWTTLDEMLDSVA